jgi:hypothetical protein
MVGFILMMRSSWKTSVATPNATPKIAVTSGIGARRRSTTRPAASAASEPITTAQLAAMALPVMAITARNASRPA